MTDPDPNDAPPERKAEACVLCVDDEPAVLSALRRTLRREPYEVVTTSDPAAALNSLQEKPVDVVIADERMPRMSGSELLKAVRQRWPSTGRIILTGYPGKAIVVKGLEARVDFLFYKPWDDEELRRTVRRLVQEVERARDQGNPWTPDFDIGGEGG